MINSNTCPDRVLNSMQKWLIGQYVRELLVTDDDMAKYVGENVYPMIAAENTRGDFITYRRTEYTKGTVKMGVYEDKVWLELIAVSDNYDNSAVIAALIDNILTGVHTTDDYKFECMLIHSEENFYENKYTQLLIFEIK